VAFVNNYFNRILQLTKQNKLVPITIEPNIADWKKFKNQYRDIDKGIRDFNKLLIDLKLDPKDYKEFHKKYRERLRLGYRLN
jgi:hypothetical protein